MCPGVGVVPGQHVRLCDLVPCRPTADIIYIQDSVGAAMHVD